MRKNLGSQGFSLVEIMIVLVIIGTILGMVATRVFGTADKAKYKQAKISMQQTIDQLEMYQQDCNTYPTSSQGLAALIKAPVGEPACESWGPSPYAKDMPKDVYGTPYSYESDGTTFELISYGKDKKPGGTAYGEDISSKKF
jgi:general secretion pathway protein G